MKTYFSSHNSNTGSQLIKLGAFTADRWKND